MQFTTFLRPLAVACALTVSLSACSSGTDKGDTNVEVGHTKARPTTHGTDGANANTDGVANGDSATSGLNRDHSGRPTGKDLYKAAGEAKDRNHDGLAD